MSPGKPRISGELRLRLTSSDDPSSFKSGSDVLRSDGQLWSRPLHALPKYYSPLYDKLREEQFVPDDLDAALSTLPSYRPSYRRCQFLYTLNDTFLVDFSSYGWKLILITEQGVESIPIFDIFVDGRKLQQSTPYIYKSPSLDTPILIILMNL
jgi:hypothetical protein